MSTIEQLEARIKQLEDKINKSNQMFGRSYSTNGSSSSDYLIKTRGQVKIQIGNRFIDLIKDGKINADLKFIFQRDSVGVKDGIYVIGKGNNQQIILQVNGNQINLKGEIGTTYVSFQDAQYTSSEQKQTALRNIGFIYNTIEEIPSSVVNNGIIYITSEQKLYIVSDGVISEYYINLPTPYTKQFVIAKNDANTGAIVIKGKGTSNSLAFDDLVIYVDEGNSYVNSSGIIDFFVNGNKSLTVNKNGIVVNDKITASMLQSPSSSNDSGYRLYMDGDRSILEIDKIIERDAVKPSPDVVPDFYSLNNNIILSNEDYNDNSLNSEIFLSLKYVNQYAVGDYLYMYGEVIIDKYSTQLVKIPVIVTSIENDNVIAVKIIKGINLEVDSLSELPNLVNKPVMLIVTENDVTENISQLRYSNNSIDLIQYNSIEEEQNISSVSLRIGNLSDLSLTYNDNSNVVNIQNFGLYSSIGWFKEAGYISGYDLPINNKSSKFASTEWVQNLLPVGSIIMFNGSTIPEGWVICDGNNNTPNLSGYFIKAGQTAGDIDTYNVISGENAEEGQSIIQFQSYSLIFIMKTV